MFTARRLIARPFLRIAARPIHVTARRFAAADPPNMSEAMMNDPKIRETFEKLSRHPPAMAAMQKLGEIVKSKGIYSKSLRLLLADRTEAVSRTGFDANTPPSKMDMMKLVADYEFREAAQELQTEMQNAGIKIQPDTFMKMMEGALADEATDEVSKATQ
ncbi:hypothetical protein FZEAL_5404 [Fusarium zealandicum]|uniref:Uncharacterized protein n=1 Tax=Fusarium zealandicum TaxID=1053134 RepID=A0A8H4UK76_9HYPO|nr:hypothetical protein FZEAL_5404 [Fusarium zealandicum]